MTGDAPADHASQQPGRLPRYEVHGDTIYDRSHPEYGSAMGWVARARDNNTARQLASALNELEDTRCPTPLKK